MDFLTIYASIPLIILYIVSYVREFLFGTIVPNQKRKKSNQLAEGRREPEGYAPLFKSQESFWIRNIVSRGKDCLHQPVSLKNGSEITIVGREFNDDYCNYKLKEDSSKTKYVNFGSNDYLGLAETQNGLFCKEAVKTISSMGLSTCSTRQELGTSAIHQELEQTVAEFIGAEDAVTFGTGFGRILKYILDPPIHNPH